MDLRARAWFNPSLESRVYNVPAVVGVIVMMMCLMLTSLGIVREREVGTLEQLLVSPLCVRPLPKAPVSTPLSWSEVNQDLDLLDFTIETPHRPVQLIARLSPLTGGPPARRSPTMATRENPTSFLWEDRS